MLYLCQILTDFKALRTKQWILTAMSREYRYTFLWANKIFVAETMLQYIRCFIVYILNMVLPYLHILICYMF